ncbi:MAG: hypothetical protein SGPRY_000167 [Prymnesium sp.]
MQSSMGESGVNDAEMGNTYWASWREEQGVSEDGQFPAGEDMVEKELKRMFNLDETSGSFSTQEIDDVQLMFKLRKELGDADFKRIFGDFRINGPPLA